ncbi:biotin--[acetyl-CoA-carboxylase] ligase [uncultured Polaribacter sp.]|uniref:biotin--[acetyl-CoA-carboxylase] ligase n=1 Tax=uncultured Polaribacter sp. TaxID=174711 RepID=UPI0026215BB1|nr:biotin--[acetyl-CoA-carboxylase] ligase [uncultured Polaribacter sp.]
MKIIKLNATESTNSFLKNLSQNSDIENLTVVVSEKQTNGRGQQDQAWLSEPFKNLTFSVFNSFDTLKIEHQKHLNFAVSIAIYNVLSNKKIAKLSIKWPNDIMSANKKICGILIENTFAGSKIKKTVIGIGLNVNQTEFPKSIKNVTSLKLETNTDHNLTPLLKEILKEIQTQILKLENNRFKSLEEKYVSVLYKKDIPSMFKDSNGLLFLGIITGISKTGNLLIQLENNSIKEFGIKEVRFL